ncbi:MAG: histidinol-phosphatase HisJ family protein [Clostridia bacterium]|nr:histidinol-phosphatase HisJ family protein [Clostridia bacterium]
MLFDYHVHTAFSGDCSVPMEEIVVAAIRQGMQEICFTDHLDFDSTDGTDQFQFSASDYQVEVARLKDRYENKISIKAGVEVGLQPHVLEASSKFVRQGAFDFALGSMHGCERMDFYLGDFFSAYGTLEAIEHYYEEMFQMIATYKDYSVIGHLDIYKRYNPDSKRISLQSYDHLIEKVFKQVIADDKGIEINTSGLRGDLGEALPNWNIIEIYKELGGKVITLGSDSHGTGTLCANFEEVLRGLAQRGYKNVYRFDKMQPVETSINSLL